MPFISSVKAITQLKYTVIKKKQIKETVFLFVFLTLFSTLEGGNVSGFEIN